MKIVQIKSDGCMDDIEINVKKTIENNIKNIYKNCGSGKIKELYTWSYNNYLIYCYGWYEGEGSFKNKHKLMSYGNSKFLEVESSEIDLYGDIFLVKKQKNKYVPFCTIEYAEITEYFNNNLEEYHNDYDTKIYEKNETTMLNNENSKKNYFNEKIFQSEKNETININSDKLLDIDENNYYQNI
jgi:hypothetical protein